MDHSKQWKLEHWRQPKYLTHRRFKLMDLYPTQECIIWAAQRWRIIPLLRSKGSSEVTVGNILFLLGSGEIDSYQSALLAHQLKIFQIYIVFGIIDIRCGSNWPYIYGPHYIYIRWVGHNGTAANTIESFDEIVSCANPYPSKQSPQWLDWSIFKVYTHLQKSVNEAVPRKEVGPRLGYNSIITHHCNSHHWIRALPSSVEIDLETISTATYVIERRRLGQAAERYSVAPVTDPRQYHT